MAWFCGSLSDDFAEAMDTDVTVGAAGGQVDEVFDGLADFDGRTGVGDEDSGGADVVGFALVGNTG